MKRFSILLAIAAIVTVNTCVVASAEGIPDAIVKELDSLVGTWTVEGKIGDKVQTGEFTLRWARTEDKQKICLTGKFLFVVGGDENRGVTLIGWNAAKKCIEDRGFDANGGNEALYWKVESPAHWKGEIVGSANGKTVTAKADFIKRSDTDWVFEAEYNNGDVVRSVLRKVKQERKKKAKE